MVPAWRGNMDAVETAIVEHDGFAWQNFHCIDGSSDGVACRSSTPSKGGECSAFLRKSCQSGSLVQTSAVQYKIGYAFNADHSNISLTGFEMDLGVFLASRGNYSWLGCKDAFADLTLVVRTRPPRTFSWAHRVGPPLVRATASPYLPRRRLAWVRVRVGV